MRPPNESPDMGSLDRRPAGMEPATGIQPGGDAAIGRELDYITLSGIRAHGFHGLFDFERENGQDFSADVVIGLDLSAASGSDRLDDTVDYGALAQQIHEAIVGEPVGLVESLALRMVDLCLSHAPVQWARVTVHKPHAPITVAFDNVSVTIERSKK